VVRRYAGLHRGYIIFLFTGLAWLSPGLAGAEGREHGRFHGHDVHRFSHEDFRIWRGGFWRHEWHDGRFGWWWFVGGIAYFYPAPVYPYPLAVSEVIYAPAPIVVAPAVPPTTVVAPPSPPVSPQGTTVVAPQNPTSGMWYYCDSAKGYYPYVQQCPEPWRSVPAAPPGVGNVPR
jgi:hypothetical protein